MVGRGKRTTLDKLEVFEQLLESPVGNSQAIRGFLEDTKAIDFLDVLSVQNGPLFLKALRRNSVGFYLCQAGHGDWLVEKLDSVEMKPLADVLSTDGVVFGLAEFAGKTKWLTTTIDQCDADQTRRILKAHGAKFSLEQHGAKTWLATKETLLKEESGVSRMPA